MGDLWVVGIICCVVSETGVVVVDGVDVDGVGIVVDWHGVVGVVGDFVDLVDVWVVGVDVVG